MGRRWSSAAAAVLLVLCTACGREDPAPDDAATGAATRAGAGDGSVTISGDDSIARQLTWRVPDVDLEGEATDDAHARAAAALESGNLHSDGNAAIPLYLGILEATADDAAARAGLEQARRQLLEEGHAALAASGDDAEALRRAHVAAAVARTAFADDEEAQAYLAQVDAADRLWELNRSAEEALAAGRLGETGGGALAAVREALELQPGQPRAMQTRAAIESALIRRAEDAAEAGDFERARAWLDHAAGVRDGATTVADARARVERVRLDRIARLRDQGIAALSKQNGIADARELLGQMLAIAEPGDRAVAELRERIDLAVHYGLFRPGQRFTDAVEGGARGPEMIVVPHGGFRMGASDGDRAAQDNERPQRYVRFDRGFALSVREVTVAEFRRFIVATGHRTRAERRGYSMPYDERSGNFVRRSGVDWRSAYDGSPAPADAPVLHVSSVDAEAYAAWLAEESGHRYRLPSEAEFEYALRAGGTGRYPWGDEGVPPERSGNFTGALDRSSGGRRWSNAFRDYGDGHWGAAPAGSFLPNALGVHDLSGNVSEWVADCWHDSYRRAPDDGVAWVNPGCRTKVIRGGSWASAPAQTRSSWRAPAPVDTTNGRIGFRVARDL
jgi:formylglycine-generating enzyme required for sulfatase activity